MTLERILTTAQAAERAGVSTRVVREAIGRQELPAVRGAGRAWAISQDALEAWIASRAPASTREDPADSAPPEPEPIVVADERPFVLHHGFDGWLDVRDSQSAPAEEGGHTVTLSSSELAGHREVNFTRYYPDEERWEGQDHTMPLSG